MKDKAQAATGEPEVILDPDVVALVGEIAAGAYATCGDPHRAKLWAWMQDLPGFSDLRLLQEAKQAINDSAIVQPFRGNWDHVHAKGSAVYFESKRRHVRDGHDEDCIGDTIYDKAYIDATREAMGFPLTTPKQCNCSKATEGSNV